ncbi:MAG: hypothetical protein KDA88_20335 [Planctomycetaceae bacterium]|nr:hypothetical protein [Planctomycetaceae bacterium]MCB9952258.1 ABC transporter substrate-binding protein [Planctomycetaceae bacterium]
MILLGIDDTDTANSPGTNQIARRIVDALAPHVPCKMVVRHQLSHNPVIPCTSQNGSASLWFDANESHTEEIFETARGVLVANFVEGSDPGIAIAALVPQEVIDFGQSCKTAVHTQADARQIAARHGIRLEGLGGTEDGVIGALAAIGLATTRNDGRVVHLQGMSDRRGTIALAELQRLEIVVVDEASGGEITEGLVQLPKKLRPNLRSDRVVLFVEKSHHGWLAVKRD